MQFEVAGIVSYGWARQKNCFGKKENKTVKNKSSDSMMEMLTLKFWKFQGLGAVDQTAQDTILMLHISGKNNTLLMMVMEMAITSVIMMKWYLDTRWILWWKWTHKWRKISFTSWTDDDHDDDDADDDDYKFYSRSWIDEGLKKLSNGSYTEPEPVPEPEVKNVIVMFVVELLWE